MHRIVLDVKDDRTTLSVNHGSDDNPDWFIEELPARCRLSLDITENKISISVLPIVEVEKVEVEFTI